MSSTDENSVSVDLENTYSSTSPVLQSENPAHTPTTEEQSPNITMTLLQHTPPQSNVLALTHPTNSGDAIFGVSEEDSESSVSSSQTVKAYTTTPPAPPASTFRRGGNWTPRLSDIIGDRSFREGTIQSLSCAISPNSTPAATIDVLPTGSAKKKSNAYHNHYNHNNYKSISDSIYSSAGFVLDLFTSGKKDTREFTYTDIESSIGKSYIDASGSHYSSNALDVLALYIKGQKLLYTEAKTYCEQQLNFLMLPAIFISCVGSIFSFLSGRYIDGPLIIASLNGFNAFLLALISYLKLDAKAQAHKTSAYKFDKLESMCEFNSGKFMFFETKPADILDVVERIETDVKEIKETNQFILPESIRYEFSFTYSTNIFMLVKKIQSLEMAEIHSLKNCMNYIATLREQLERVKQASLAEGKPGHKDMIKRLIASINDEETRKSQFVNNILECRKQYYELDSEFNREIRKHIRRSNRWLITRLLCCDWLKS